MGRPDVRPWLLLVTGAAVAALLASCGAAAGASSTGGTPKSGGTLTFAVSSDAGCVDPQQVGSNDTIYSVRQLVDSLTDQDPATGKIVPWLAQSWQVSPDGRSFTFHLRPGVTFADGTPVNAQAVKDNFDALPKLGARAALGISYLAGYQDTVVVDDLTARVEFSAPNAQFLQATSTFSLGLVSESTVAKSADARCQSVTGSGPFVLDTYTPNQQITESRRAGYAWGSSLWTKPGASYLDRLVFKIVPESGVRVGSLESGQVDAIGNLAPQDETAVKGAGLVTQARANPGVVFGLSANNARPVAADRSVRLALQQAVNRPEVVSTVFGPETKPATSVLAATTPDYADLSSGLAFDPAGARQLLTAAGWLPGPDGIRVRNGVRLSLNVAWFANSPTNQQALELIQQQVKAVGIELTLTEHPISQIIAVEKSGDFDLLWGNTTRADPDVLRTNFWSGFSNYLHIADGPLAGVLAQQATTVDPTARAALVRTAQQSLIDNGYDIPVVELTTVLGLSTKVHGLLFDASSRIQLHDTWLS